MYYLGIFLASTSASDSVGPGFIHGLQVVCSDSKLTLCPFKKSEQTLNYLGTTPQFMKPKI
jgi:hypothetical protein